MPDYYGGVAQAGAYMMNSGLDAITSQRKLNAEKEMQAQKLAAEERMQSARIASAGGSGGAFSGNDPISKGARIQMMSVGALNAQTDNLIELEDKMNGLQKAAEQQGFWDDKSSTEMRKLKAYYNNSQTAFSLLSKSSDGGKFKYTKQDADGGQLEAEFGSMRDFETFKAASSVTDNSEKDAKSKSIMQQVRETAAKYTQPSAKPEQGGVTATPVQKARTASTDDQVDTMMQDSGVAESQENPAARGGTGRRVRTKEDIANESAASSRMRLETLKKEFESLKTQKNARGNVNTAAMRRIAGQIIEEEKKQKSGN
jgi:hypothetical protein